MVKNINVKKRLLEQNLEIKELAALIGYSREHVSGVINGRFESVKVKIAIALVLGKNYAFLWEEKKTNV